jgi:ATP-dependent exoDNAse (exonuclease V) beta subunit
MEYKSMRKNIDQPLPDFVTSLNAKDAVRYIKAREILNQLADNFYNEFIKIYTPITTEFIVGDTDLKIAGTFDLLAYNNETNEIELWDYKTDKEIKFSSEYGNKLDVFNIDDCEYNKYSLQLSIYKYLIEKNTNLKISKCNIAHFSYRKEEFEIIPVLDLTESVNTFFNNEHNKSIYFGSKTTNKRKWS